MKVDAFLITQLIALLLLSVWTDIFYKRIPNLFTYPAMIVALSYHLITNGAGGLLFGASGLMVGIGLWIVPHLMGGMGAGDTKLMGAVGCILGPKGVFIASVLTALFGGVYAVFIILINGRYQYIKDFLLRQWITVKACLYTGHFVMIGPAAKNGELPRLRYGVAIALGTLTYIFLIFSGHNFLL
jgi:prepilin peptidase CpaA